MFKYTVTGSLVGSWTIATAGAASPTGITIDPSNVSDIWIVDSGADKVFQYTAAASRTSGSQAAATSFALATGNTNPQGIADPPSPMDEDIVTGQTRAVGKRHAQAGPYAMQTESVDHYFVTVRERDSSPHSKPYVTDLLASLLEANEHLSKKGRMLRFAR